MFKIKSRFYAIYGDDVPIYIGYTNRTVKQRFTEHKRSKDFSDYDVVEVKELKDQELSFDFTWDLNIINDDADIVSKREMFLIYQFNTQNSCFQKAFGGGQNWNDIKHFVCFNKNNPKFKGMSGSEIKKYLDRQRKMMGMFDVFISDIKTPFEDSLRSFVGNIKRPFETNLSSFVSHIERPIETNLYIFIGGVKRPLEYDLNYFVNNIRRPFENNLSSFVGRIEKPFKTSLRIFVGDMKRPFEANLHNFVGHIQRLFETNLSSFVSNMHI